MNKSNDIAVAVRNCSISFKKASGKKLQICEKFNLSVPCGSIYALLGPSSCGKTSMIKAILGLTQIRKGDIFVFGQKTTESSDDKISPTDIGYMPQETCLYETLTIGETLTFFGGILGLSKKIINERIDFYIDFLRLPHKKSINGNLSGGQKRRVSFAAAIIHHPKLLLLDEPTVGLDPIIRQSIWQYLNKMATTESVSILLTTHFIEEASGANNVGMWHGDCLQAESSPDHLLASLNCVSLEDAFFQICSNSSTVQANNNGGAPTELTTKACGHLDLSTLAPRSDIPSAAFERSTNAEPDSCGLGRMTALVKKNTIKLIRYPAALIFLIFIPSVTILVFCCAFGKLTGLEIAVRTSDSGHLGNQYLGLFDPETFNLTWVTSAEEGRDGVLSGHQLAFVDIEANFSSHIIKVLTSDMWQFQQGIGEIVGNNIAATFNGVDFGTLILIKYHVLANFEKICYLTAASTGMNQSMCNPPVRLQRTIDGVDIVDVPIRVFFIPGILIIASFFAAFPCALFSFFQEKQNGCFERGYVAGISTLETMTSFVIVTAFVVVLQIIAILIVTFVLYDAPLHGSIFLVFLFLVWIAVGGMSIGYMVSALTEDVYVVCSCAISLLFISLPMSGWIWPISAMPKPMLYLANAFPFALPVKALIGIMHHGWGFLNLNVLAALAVTTAWLPILNGITIYKLRVAKR